MFETEEAKMAAEKVQGKLKDGENLLWCGVTEKSTTPIERGVPIASFIFPVFVIIFLMRPISEMYNSTDAGSRNAAVFAAIVFFGTCLGILLNAIFGTREVYAITDQRVLVMTKGGLIKRSVVLEKIYGIHFKESGRQIGYVMGRRAKSAGSNTGRKSYVSFRGIKNPGNVCTIMTDASNAAMGKYIPSQG